MEMYSLTEITGQRANEDRTMLVAGQEVGVRTARSLLVAAPIAFIATLMCMTFMGQASILVGIIVATVIVLAITYRSKSGLDINLVQMVRDKRGSNEGQLFICQRPIDANTNGALRMIISSSVPVAPVGMEGPIDELNINEMFDGPQKSRRRKGH